MQRKTLIMDEQQMRRSVTRMAHEMIERNKGVADVALVGICRRGEPLASTMSYFLRLSSGLLIAKKVINQ